MVNTSLFGSVFISKNASGHPAVAFELRHALAQMVSTGTFRNTFYTTAESQLSTILDLAKNCDPEYVAKCAIYARERGFMKDAPAFLCAYLSSIGRGDLVSKIFSRVVDSTKMLRNYVQIIRSGKLGRKSLGSNPKKQVQTWLAGKTDSELFRGSIGNDPSLADVIKMVHPKPSTPERENLFRYLIGKDYDATKLPEEIQLFESFKKDGSGNAPRVPFEMLTALSLKKEHWIDIARNASWTQTRMNLNTFMRHGVFENAEMVDLVAKRLTNPELIKKSKVFPYQLFSAYINADAALPAKIRTALEQATETATQNVPEFSGQVYVFPDVSGSMHSPVTGSRGTATTKMQCIDVAALITASILRVNSSAKVIPFGSDVVSTSINAKQGIMDMANTLRHLNGGGTQCSAPLSFVNRTNQIGDVFIYLSDNESNIDPQKAYYGGQTATLVEWNKLRQRCPEAKMICIDLAPNTTGQSPDREDILNVGGFNDEIFSVIKSFSMSQGSKFWADVIDKIEL